MTYAKLAMLAGVAVALLASACEGSQRGENPTAPQTAERQAIGQPLVIGMNQAGGPLVLIEPLAGDVIGSVDAGYNPEVLLRRTSGQLLVSQTSGPGPARAEEPSLTVYDLDDLSSPSAIIPMPGRPSFIGSPHSVLSRDERYLYYARVTSRCPNGRESEGCDEWSIGVIDLEAERQVAQVAQTKLGLRCKPRMVVDLQAEETALVICGDAGRTSDEIQPDSVRLLRVGPNGAASELGTFPGRRTGTVVFAGMRSNGTYFAVYGDGAVFDAGGEEAAGDLLPEEDGQLLFELNSDAALGSERYLLEFGSRLDHTISGVVVLNAAAPEDVRTFEFPFSSEHVHVVPLDERRVALLHGDGFEVSVLDIETGVVSDAMTLPDSVEWLSGG